MKTPKKSESGRKTRRCKCGKRITVPEGSTEIAICPQCGAAVDAQGNFTSSHLSSGDTQMVNLKEMARMAQEGIDVSSSGEWDTSHGAGSQARKK